MFETAMKGLSLAFLFAGLVIALFLPDPIEWVCTAAIVSFFIRQFFKPRVFPVALMAFTIPIVEIATSLLNTGLSGLTLMEGFGPGASEAYLLSVFSLFAFMLGFLILGKRAAFDFNFELLKEKLAEISMARLITAHILSQLLFSGIKAGFGYGSSLFQLVLHFQKFPLVLLYVIGWKYALERKNSALVSLVFVSNLLIRLTGFFSEWKELLFLAIFVGLGVSKEFNAKAIRRLIVIGGIGMGFLLTWQGVKMEYRQFLNGGARSQRVVVGASDALSFFAELVGDFWLGSGGDNQSTQAFESTLDRLGYLEFFAKTVHRVPAEIPHEGGDLLLDNLSFALVPRILNPNKGVKDDQWKVEYYANVMISDHSSFSLGRYAEWYVDFGGVGMICFAFFAGTLAALIVRMIFTSPGPVVQLIDAIYLTLSLQLWMSYQADEITIYGQTFWGILVYVVIGRRLMHWLIYRRTMRESIVSASLRMGQFKTGK